MIIRRIINEHTGFFGEAYNLSYTDIYDFSAKKQSLKKFEIELGIHHQELGLPWDQPVPKSLWDKVAEYCDNDVLATEAVFNARHADFVAREILADIAGLTVNDTTNTLTTRIIFGKEKHPKLVYTDLATGEQDALTEVEPDILVSKNIINAFPGYEWTKGDDGRMHNMFRGTDLGLGGYVYAEPGMYWNVALLDVASLHPHSAVAMNYFGEYTKNFNDLINQQTNVTVLAKPEYNQKYAYEHQGDIQSLGDYHSDDGGETFQKLQRPSSMSSDRVAIRYGDEGGLDKDGVIEIRRGVDDLSFGNSHYAQVRIMVDNSHYLKGMAVYSDDVPDGYDVIFNTNKPSGTPKMKVLKPIKDDPDNPFGAALTAAGQSEYIGADGKKHLSPINKLREEGEWDTMAKNLSSQFLSKQPIKLIKQQLNLTLADRKAEYEEIMNYDNPTIKKKLLIDFADTCEGNSMTLKASSFPGQSTKVILPLTKISEKECYCPTYENGTQLALIRYPHAGTFEIPIVTVNNKNVSGKRNFGNIQDAIGINSKVAERLSGADFDGDTVVAIPISSKVAVKATAALRDLKDFDPKTAYAVPEGNPNGVRLMKKEEKQKEMGIISNLITDMTLRGADEKEIARAVKHSMVVIDAEKHKLDYKRSERENGIQELKKKWQMKRLPKLVVFPSPLSTVL